MPLRRALFKLPLPVPTPHATPATLADAKAALLDERARLHLLSTYRSAIASNNLVTLDGLPHDMPAINTMIADQRAVIAQCEADLVALAATPEDMAMP